MGPERLEPQVDRPVGAVLEQLGAGEAEHEDRSVDDRRRQALEQVVQRRLRPVDVVDDHDERPVGRVPRRGTWRIAARRLGGVAAPSASPSSCAIVAATAAVRHALECAVDQRRASAVECSSRIPVSSRTICATAQ